jgi:glycosyltransferase involved in cell wall biosynthesis
MMSQCHVFAHFAENDNAPNVVVEALASGLPVLYRHSGGTPEIVDGNRFGEALEGNKIENAEKSLRRLISRYNDLIDDVKMGRERFLIDSTVKAYSAVFHKLTDRKFQKNGF